MKVWPIAIGAGALTGVALLIHRSLTTEEEPIPVPDPLPSYGETTRVALAVPSGWRRVTSSEVTPELSSQAISLRNTPGFSTMSYGTLSPFVVSDGQTYATWIEQHYHEPGGAIRPWGYHHGVTLLARS